MNGRITTFTAPRFADGEGLGRFPVVIVRHLQRLAGVDTYLVRFEDGHEAAAFVYELAVRNTMTANEQEAR